MGEVITSRLCRVCNQYHRKNSDISGDYDEEGKLLSYCPQCGSMHPPRLCAIIDFNLSQRKRHNLGTLIARTHDLPYRQMHKITSGIKFVDDNEFPKVFSKHISETFDISFSREDVIEYIKRSGNIIKR